MYGHGTLSFDEINWGLPRSVALFAQKVQLNPICFFVPHLRFFFNFLVIASFNSRGS